MIFDWEVNGQELRFRDPRSGADTGVQGQGAIPKNAWATIKWVIDGSGMTVSVNGKERGNLKGDFSKMSEKVGVSTVGKAVLTFR